MTANRLRVARAEQRISQLELALAARMNPTRLWRIENGYVTPSAAERQAIAEALDLPMERIWVLEDVREVGV